MGRFSKSLLLVAPTLLALNGAQADLTETVKAYNSKYQQVLENNSTWKQQIADAKQEVTVAQEAYNEVLEKSAPARNYYEHILFETKKLRGSVKVWEAMSPLAKSVQGDVAIEAANTEKDFSSPSDVTLASLISKTSELSALINKKDDEIAVQDGKILLIKTSPAYIAVAGSVSSAKEALRLAKAKLSRLIEEASDLANQLGTQEWELAESTRRQSVAQNRITNIEVVEIPGLTDQKDVRTDSLEDLRKNKLQPLRLVLQDLRNNKIPAKRAQVQATEIIISELPENTPESDKAKLIEKLSNQKAMLAELQDQLAKGEFRRDRLVEQRDRLVQEIASLDAEIIRLRNEELVEQRQIVANEIIYQNEVRSLIRSIEDRQRSNELAQITANSDISHAVDSLSFATTAYNKFSEENISPIEDVIDGLEAVKRGYVNRRSNVIGWKNRIVRQDNNLTEIAENLEQRIAELQVMETDLEVAKQTMDGYMILVGETLAETNIKIADYNTLVAPIRENLKSFRDTEKLILDSLEK